MKNRIFIMVWVAICLIISFTGPASSCLVQQELIGWNSWSSGYEFENFDYADNAKVKGSWANVNPMAGSSTQIVLSPSGFFPASLSRTLEVQADDILTLAFDYNLWSLRLFGRNGAGDDLIVSLVGDNYYNEVLRVNVNDKWRSGATILGWEHFETDLHLPMDMELEVLFELDNFRDPQLTMAFLNITEISALNENNGADVVATPIPSAIILLLPGVMLLAGMRKK